MVRPDISIKLFAGCQQLQSALRMPVCLKINTQPNLLLLSELNLSPAGPHKESLLCKHSDLLRTQRGSSGNRLIVSSYIRILFHFIHYFGFD